MRKKLLSIALAVFLAASNLPVSAVQAAEVSQETTAGSETVAEVPQDTVAESEAVADVPQETTAESETASGTDAATTEPEETDMLKTEEEQVADESSESGNLVELSKDNFPDEAFREYLKNTFDKDNDDKIDVSAITKISVYDISITDLTGIDKFTELTSLTAGQFAGGVAQTSITELDASKNKKLTYLEVASDNLERINVSECVDLETLNISYGSLEGLDVTKNRKLTTLVVDGDFSTLDVSQNTALEVLYVYSPELERLELANNLALKYLYVYSNALKYFDISKNTELTYLTVASDKLSSLDVRNNTKLTSLQIGHAMNDVITIDDISCDALSSLDLSQNKELTSLEVYANNLTSLDVSGNTELTNLEVYADNLTFLEAEGCDSLTSLDVSTNPALKELYVSYPIHLTVGSKNTALEYVCLNYGDCVMPEKADLSYLHGFSFSDTSGRYDSNKKTLVTNPKGSHSFGAYSYWEASENGTNVLIELTATSRVTPTVTTTYSTHVQTYGWKKGESKNGAMSGTSGEAKRLEAIKLSVSGNEELGIQYTTHCQSYGWLPWSANGELNGTEGEAKRLEAIKIQLTGDDADLYDVYYRVHAQSYGWLGWAKNGAPAGTAGLAKRLEGIQVVVVKKGEAAPGLNYAGVNAAATTHNDKSYIANSGTSPVVGGSNTSNANPTIGGTSTINVAYKTHVQTYGWQGWKYNGAMSGTSGQAKRLEGINIKLTNQIYDGDIVYTTHVQTYGWQGSETDQSKWSKNGAMSGTSGQAKRLEAIKIALTDEMAEHYDVYYRVHAQSYGWLSWAKNGEAAGTAGLAKRLEGIQIVLVPKGSAAPASNYGGITSVRSEAYISK